MTIIKSRMKKIAAGVAAATLALSGMPLMAAEMEEVVVVGDLGSLPGENVQSVCVDCFSRADGTIQYE
jgi:hypothetical protein